MKPIVLLSTLAVSLIAVTPLLAQSSTTSPTYSPAFGYPSYAEPGARSPATTGQLRMNTRFGKGLISPRLVGAERAATPQQQHRLFERQALFRVPRPLLHDLCWQRSPICGGLSNQPQARWKPRPLRAPRLNRRDGRSVGRLAPRYGNRFRHWPGRGARRRSSPAPSRLTKRVGGRDFNRRGERVECGMEQLLIHRVAHDRLSFIFPNSGRIWTMVPLDTPLNRIGSTLEELSTAKALFLTAPRSPPNARAKARPFQTRFRALRN